MERDLEAYVKSIAAFVNRCSFVTESTPQTAILNTWLPLYPRGICKDEFHFYLLFETCNQGSTHLLLSIMRSRLRIR